MNQEIGVALLVAIVAVVVMRLFETRVWRRSSDDHALCEQQIAQLTLEMEQQRQRYEGRIRELEKRVDFLVEQLQRAGIQIKELERKASQPAPDQRTAPEQPQLLSKPMLVICGADATMCDLDRRSIRRAGIPFQRLYHATKPMVADELRRRRQDGTLYPWLHVTAHASQAGIELEDGVADPAWWHEHLDGVEVVFLAACETSAVADALAGLVTVIFVQEQIENRDASDFTYAFWRRIREHGNARLAYQQAIAEAPQVAEFSDIRTG